MSRNVRFLGLGVGAGVISAAVLGQPMVGTVLVLSCFAAFVLGHSLGVVPWAALAVKLALVAVVSVVVPVYFGGELIPVNPDQTLYLATAEHIAEALAQNPLHVDYAGIVGLHNRLYSVLLGWMAFLNRGGTVLLYRLFNVFLSMVLAALGFVVARTLNPQAKGAWTCAFLGCSLLPSVNAYAMFVLRDVLIGTLVLLIAVGLWTRRYWLVVLGLPVVFYTRIQLFFLLVGGSLLYGLLLFAPRLGRWAAAARGLALVGFVMVGYFVAPLVLPPEYDYSQAWNVAGVARFVWSFLPSFLSLDFLRAGPESLELGRASLWVARVILFDTWVLPVCFLLVGLLYRRMGRLWRDFYLWAWALVLGYAAGYWIAYGGLMIRLWLPLYPVLLVAVIPVLMLWFGSFNPRLSGHWVLLQGFGGRNG